MKRSKRVLSLVVVLTMAAAMLALGSFSALAETDLTPLSSTETTWAIVAATPAYQATGPQQLLFTSGTGTIMYWDVGLADSANPNGKTATIVLSEEIVYDKQLAALLASLEATDTIAFKAGKATKVTATVVHNNPIGVTGTDADCPIVAAPGITYTLKTGDYIDLSNLVHGDKVTVVENAIAATLGFKLKNGGLLSGFSSYGSGNATFTDAKYHMSFPAIVTGEIEGHFTYEFDQTNNGAFDVADEDASNTTNVNKPDLKSLTITSKTSGTDRFSLDITVTEVAPEGEEPPEAANVLPTLDFVDDQLKVGNRTGEVVYAIMKNGAPTPAEQLTAKWQPVCGGAVDIKTLIPKKDNKTAYLALRISDDLHSEATGYSTLKILELKGREAAPAKALTDVVYDVVDQEFKNLSATDAIEVKIGTSSRWMTIAPSSELDVPSYSMPSGVQALARFKATGDEPASNELKLKVPALQKTPKVSVGTKRNSSAANGLDYILKGAKTTMEYWDVTENNGEWVPFTENNPTLGSGDLDDAIKEEAGTNAARIRAEADAGIVGNTVGILPVRVAADATKKKAVSYVQYVPIPEAAYTAPSATALPNGTFTVVSTRGAVVGANDLYYDAVQTQIVHGSTQTELALDAKADKAAIALLKALTVDKDNPDKNKVTISSDVITEIEIRTKTAVDLTAANIDLIGDIDDNTDDIKVTISGVNAGVKLPMALGFTAKNGTNTTLNALIVTDDSKILPIDSAATATNGEVDIATVAKSIYAEALVEFVNDATTPTTYGLKFKVESIDNVFYRVIVTE